MAKSLKIPAAKNRVPGMMPYCEACKRIISGDNCFDNGKPLKQCPHKEKHGWKMYVKEKGSNVRRTKNLKARDYDSACIEGLQFRKAVKGNSFSKETIVKNKRVINKEAGNIPLLLLHAIARYDGWLRNEGVPAHRKKERSAEHIKDVERAFKLFVQCLKENGYDVPSLNVDDLNDKMTGEVYEYLLNDKDFANRTFNKYFSYYTSFLKWYSDEYDVPVRNWFEKVKRKKINPKPEAITKEEYEALLKQITPENGIKEYETGKKPIRHVYRPWLKDGIRLALETGRRREEVISLKFSDIIRDGNGNAYIKVEDFKTNRIQNRNSEEEKKYIFIPVTKSLQKLLNELGYEKYQNTDSHILAPEVKISRTRIMSDTLSNGFSHYYNQLDTGRKLTFKSLRKTYITNLSVYMGGNAKAITQHSDDAVIEKYYLDKQALSKAAQGFEVFKAENGRKKELKIVRNRSSIKQKMEGIEK